MEELAICGRAQVHAILPLPWVLSLLDTMLAVLLAVVVNRASATSPRSFFECAKRGRQILDLTFALSQVIEKGCDDGGCAAVAQSDIKQFYDYIRPVMIVAWLRQNGLLEADCVRFRRLHCLPTVILKVGDA